MLRFVDSSFSLDPMISLSYVAKKAAIITKLVSFDRWSFWGIYYNCGLDRSFKPLFWNIYVILLSALNIAITFASAFAFSKLINDMNTGHYSSAMYVLLVPVIFSREMIKGLRRLLRCKIEKIKDTIITQIFNSIVGHLNKANADIRGKHTLTEMYEGFCRFMWAYDNVSDILFDSLTLSIQTFVFTVYVLVNDPILFFPFFGMYYLMWSYIIPYTSTNDKHFQNPDVMWKHAYNDMTIENDNYTNPPFNNLYQAYKNQQMDRSVFRSEKLETIMRSRFNWNESNKDEQKIAGPTISENFVKIIQYYDVRNSCKRDRMGIILISQNIFVFVLVAVMFYMESYASALLILMNKSTLFGAFEVLNDIKNIENSSSRNLEKIVTILKDIDNQIGDNAIMTDNNGDNINMKIQKISKIQKIIIDDITLKLITEKDKEGKTRQFQISLRNAEIDVRPGKCLLIEGKSGCGKSVIMNVLTGMYSGSKYPETIIVDDNGNTHNLEFNQIKHNRVYISQLISEDYKYNGNITFQMFELFPNAKDIDEIKRFLIDIFSLRADRIPNNISDTAPERLSGGEIQRYVIASQIWKILKTSPDILFLDEIDRALDKDTAVHLIEWILTNIGCYCVIVTHLSEVRDMINTKNFINQRWTYIPKSDSITEIEIIRFG